MFISSLFLVTVISLAAAKIPTKISFAIVGDWGTCATGTGIQKGAAKSMAQYATQNPVDLVVSVGDNFYPHGVESIDDPLFDECFTQMYSAPSLQKPWYSILGNHDYAGNVTAVLDWKGDRRWNIGKNYTLRIPMEAANLNFVFVDTTPMMTESFTHPESRQMTQQVQNENWEAQMDWLDDTLAQIRRDDPTGWLIVFGHHWIYSGAGRDKDLYKKLNPLLEQHSVNAYICGHTHSLEYLRGDNGINYIISGTGGKIKNKEHTPVDQPGVEQTFYSQLPGYMAVEASGTTMDLVWYGDKQKKLFKTRISL